MAPLRLDSGQDVEHITKGVRGMQPARKGVLLVAACTQLVVAVRRFPTSGTARGTSHGRCPSGSARHHGSTSVGHPVMQKAERVRLRRRRPIRNDVRKMLMLQPGLKLRLWRLGRLVRKLQPAAVLKGRLLDRAVGPLVVAALGIGVGVAVSFL